MGLITLERDSVAASRWFRVRAGNSVQEIAVPKDFEGRAYVNVSLARSLSSPDVFMQPHSYAVAPLTVNVARRDMGLRNRCCPAARSRYPCPPAIRGRR